MTAEEPARPSNCFRSLSADAASRVDDICDVFETKLLTGQQPRVEEYIGSFPEPDRSALLCELLMLELEYAAAKGLTPDRGAYHERFPADPLLVNDVFDHVFPESQQTTPTEQEVEPLPTIPNYQILRKLGRGGMGTVYKALQIGLKREVAIKVLREDRMQDFAARLRFKQEMDVVGQLKHPNIVEAYDAGNPADQYFLAMEYVDGLDLARILLRCGPLRVADACELVRRAAIGLQRAHKFNLVHRDIKPSNLLLGHTSDDDETNYDAGVELKIADLGLARICNASTLCDEPVQYEKVMGTLNYMAPEQLFTPSKVDIRADIYSLGCTLFVLLLGHPPYNAKARYKAAIECGTTQLEDPLPELRSARPDVSEALQRVVHQAMANDAGGRFQVPIELARQLAPFCAGHDLPALLRTALDSPDPPTLEETAPTRTMQVVPSQPVPSDSRLEWETDNSDELPPEDRPTPAEPAATTTIDPATTGTPSTRGSASKETAQSWLRQAWIWPVGFAVAASVLIAVSLLWPRTGTVDLLAQVDPERDSVKGTWQFNGAVLQSSNVPQAVLRLPAPPAEQYRLEIVERSDDRASLEIGLVYMGRQVSVETLRIVQLEDPTHLENTALNNDSADQKASETAQAASRLGFEQGAANTYTCIVRNSGYLVAYEDDVLAYHLASSPPPDEQFLPQVDPDRLFLIAKYSHCEIAAIRITPLDNDD